VLGQAGELRVWSRAGEDLCVAGGGGSAPFALERPSDHGGATALASALNDLVDERHEIVIEANSDLLAHTKTVPEWERWAC
jgi:hypothetical protein